MIETDIA